VVVLVILPAVFVVVTAANRPAVVAAGLLVLILGAVEAQRLWESLHVMTAQVRELHQRVSALEDLERELHRHLTARVRLELTKLLRDSQRQPPAWFVAHDQTRES